MNNRTREAGSQEFCFITSHVGEVMRVVVAGWTQPGFPSASTNPFHPPTPVSIQPPDWLLEVEGGFGLGSWDQLNTACVAERDVQASRRGGWRSSITRPLSPCRVLS